MRSSSHGGTTNASPGARSRNRRSPVIRYLTTFENCSVVLRAARRSHTAEIRADRGFEELAADRTTFEDLAARLVADYEGIAAD